MQLFMAPADSDTPDYVSKAIGNFTRKARSKSWTMGQVGKSNTQEREEGARLLRPEDLRNLSSNDVVLLIHNSNPILTQKVIYFEDLYLKPIFEQQHGPFPEPQKLTMKTITYSANGHRRVGAAAPAIDLSDGAEISKQDFERIKGSQAELLAKVEMSKT